MVVFRVVKVVLKLVVMEAQLLARVEQQVYCGRLWRLHQLCGQYLIPLMQQLLCRVLWEQRPLAIVLALARVL